MTQVADMLEDRVKMIREVMDGMTKAAKHNLEEAAKIDDGFQGVAFVLSTETNDEGKTGISVIPLSGDKESRNREVRLIHANLGINHCDALILILDGWTWQGPDGVLDKDELLRLRAEGKLKKGEALTVMVASKHFPAELHMYEYVRKGKTIEWGRAVTNSEFESWMVPKEWALPLTQGRA